MTFREIIGKVKNLLDIIADAEDASLPGNIKKEKVLNEWMIWLEGFPADQVPGALKNRPLMGWAISLMVSAVNVLAEKKSIKEVISGVLLSDE
jgi:hypothetical protein